jgi:dTDP-4-amino-4,6-dideoxygalactose transaminase
MMQAAGIGAGDEVISTAFTFVASLEAIVQLGARPVLVDIDRDTFNIDVTQIEKAITPRTKAILPVHLFGQLANVTELKRIADHHGISRDQFLCHEESWRCRRRRHDLNQ